MEQRRLIIGTKAPHGLWRDGCWERVRDSVVSDRGVLCGDMPLRSIYVVLVGMRLLLVRLSRCAVDLS